MKKLILSFAALILAVNCMAQGRFMFPFQGGSEAMTKFFKDSTQVSEVIKERKLTGSVIFKFTSDDHGNISKLVLYYADDVHLVPPLLLAFRHSSNKWLIPDHEKDHDFLLPFMISVNPSGGNKLAVQLLASYKDRKPVLPHDQIPLLSVTLLPAIVVNYDAE